MSNSRQRRLDLLFRLREMHVEQARADHMVAQAKLEECRERANDTEQRLQTLDAWAIARLSGGGSLAPEILRQAQLFRGAEKQTLEQQRADEARSEEHTTAAHDELKQRFEQLSIVERLATRLTADRIQDDNRRAAVDLDEAGIQRMNLESQE